MEHFMTLDDRTVISYARTKKEGELRVIIEKPDPTDYSHSVTCLLPDYKWMNNHGFTERDLEKYRKVLEQAQWPQDSSSVLVLAPETFTSHLYTDEITGNESVVRFQSFLQRHPGASLIFGASSYDRTVGYSAPNPCSYDLGPASADNRHLWYTAHNSAILMDAEGPRSLYHKLNP